MRRGFALVLVLVFLTASCIIEAKPVSGGSAVENSWVEKASIPTARGYLRTAVVNEKIYAIGGNIFGSNEEYDPATDTWTTKASMPDPQPQFAIAVCQGKIYCIGGMPAGSLGGSGANQVYDPETDSWENKASMPTGRFGLQAQVVDDRIYLIGGRKLLGYNLGFEELNVTEVYDPVSDTWSTKSSIPNSAGYVSVVVDDKIFVIGAVTQIYDPKINTWSIGTAPIEKLVMGVNDESAATAATTGEMAPKRIYVYDGSYLQVYDPLKNSWTFGANPPINRQYLSIAVVNDTLYFIGGFTDHFNNIPGYFKEYNTNEQYIPFGYGTIEQQTFPTATVATISVVTALGIAIAAGLIFYFKKCHH
jgi:N-acetylneuraminic acid mutarotase